MQTHFFPQRRLLSLLYKAQLLPLLICNRNISSNSISLSFHLLNRITMAPTKKVLHLRSEQKLYEHRSALVSLLEGIERVMCTNSS
jgi:hypothetical protein